MVTLQEVIILRITDFRRFFEWNEFWAKKCEFVEFFKKDCNKTFFVDNEREYYLLQKLLDWLKEPDKEHNQVVLEDDVLKIGKPLGDMLKYQLGGLQQKIKEAKKVLTNKTIIGYTLLYLLLGADGKNSNIEIRYETFDENKKFNNLYNDVQFKCNRNEIQINAPKTRKIFTNSSNRIITINDYELAPQDCIVGIFYGDILYKLLPNRCERANLSFRLVKHPDRETTCLKITGTPDADFRFPRELVAENPNGYLDEYIDDVVSFITNRYGLATLDINGNFSITESWWIVEDLKEQNNGNKVLAIIDENTVITE